MILDTITEDSYCKDEGKNEILSKWVQISQNLQIKKHVPIYYDAWQNDCDDDPIYSLIYQMTLDTENINGLKDKINFNDVLNTAGKITGIVAGKLSEHLAGVNPNEIVENLKKDDFLETLRARKDIDKRIEEYIDKLLPEGCDRLLIIVDELDRCNPEFAVKLLERIKHYFNNDKVTFVFSVNLAELQHTIKHHYGADFNASRYLDRFFDLRIQLPQPNMERYLKFHKIYDNYTFDDSLKLVIIKYNLQLREISKYIQLARTAVSDLAYNPNLRINNAMTFVIQVIIPITIALMVTDNKKYNEFINGNDISVLREFYSEKETIENTSDFLSFLYNENQNTYYFADEIMSDMDLFYNKLDTFYNCFFKQFQNAKVGMCSITKIERNNFKKLISLLSDTAMKNLENKED